MLSSRNHCAASVACLTIAFAFGSSAKAGQYAALKSAAREYRISVQSFERFVHGLRYLNRFDARLVERLEDASREFYSATFRPNDVPRLVYQWNEIESLQPRIAEALFLRDCYPLNLQLAQCWEQVMSTYLALALQLFGNVNQHSPNVYDTHHQPHGVSRTPVQIRSLNERVRAKPTLNGGRAVSAGREVRAERSVGLHGGLFR